MSARERLRTLLDQGGTVAASRLVMDAWREAEDRITQLEAVPAPAAVIDRDEVTQHQPACSECAYAGSKPPPLYCRPCSEAAGDWVTWTPEHLIAGLRLRTVTDIRAAVTASRLPVTGHRPDCIGQTNADLPDACDCRTLEMIDAFQQARAEGAADLAAEIRAAIDRAPRYTCPTECVERSHPGREHHEWLRSLARALVPVDTTTPEDSDCGHYPMCVHDLPHHPIDRTSRAPEAGDDA